MSQRGGNKIRYPGELNQPIIKNLPPRNTYLAGLLSTPETQNEIQKKYEADCQTAWAAIHAEWVRRLGLLANYYGVKWPEEKERLLIRLALEHVPGLRIVDPPEKRGRKTLWSFERLCRLAFVVAEVKKCTGYTDRDACKFIAKNPNYAGEWGRPSKHTGTPGAWVETLESRLQDARRQQRELDQIFGRSVFGSAPFGFHPFNFDAPPKVP